MGRFKVFVSYSHKDARWLGGLRDQLGVLEREGLIDVFADTQIAVGEDWFNRLHEEMLVARIAILLVSAPFLGSLFIRRDEVPRLFKQHEAAGMAIYPLLVRDCAWQEVGWLARLQMRPLNAKSLASMRSAAREACLANVAREVATIVKADTQPVEQVAPPASVGRAEASSSDVEILRPLASASAVSSVSAALALLKEMGLRFDRPPVEQTRGRLTWHAVEERFGRIPGEVQVIWQRYATGHVEWSVYSRDSRDGRTVDRFISEARIAGQMARDHPAIPRKFPGARFEDEADNWLNIIATFVRLDLVGSGRDEQGEYEGGAIENAVDASRMVCARIASEPAAGSSRVAKRLLELHRHVVHDILNVAPPTQEQRGVLAAEWIPRARKWDGDVVDTMRELGCTADEVHYVETFPLPTTNRRDWFVWEMNCQWTISDIRREILEKVIDRYLDRPIFTG